MNKRVYALTVIILLVMVGVFLHYGLPKIKSTSKIQVEVIPPNTSIQMKNVSLKTAVKVKKVIDGDTIILENGESVRLIGVDAPETHHPEVPVQRFGKEATEFLKRYVEGYNVRLEYEEGNTWDQYGRLLAYVYLGNVMVNKEIIRRGYGYAYTRFPFKYKDEFIALEKEARSKQYGLWNYSLSDGRIANIVKRYEALNMQGKDKFDQWLDSLDKYYPFDKPKTLDTIIHPKYGK